MKKLILALGLACAAATLPNLASAQAGAKANAQTDKMTQCNTDATAKGLRGADRKAFMKDCLGAKPGAGMQQGKGMQQGQGMQQGKGAAMTKDGKPLTAQQQKMVTCNADAKTKGLKGAERKAFMKECLSNKK